MVTTPAPPGNLYDPDKARARVPRRPVKPDGRPMGLLIAAILEAWTSGYTAVTAPSTLREFKNLFAGFGGDLPGLTQTLLAMNWLWFPFALVAIAMLIWIGVRAKPSDAERRRMKLALWIFGVLFGISIAWAAVAIYIPIFKLSSAV